MAGPLEGIRILDWTQWQMGPVATAMLADLGAAVIHIEHRVAGDPGRGLKATGAAELPAGKSAYFECNNRGKKGITLDLAKRQGREVAYRLVRNADVFVHNFRQGVPEKLGVDYETLCAYNPRLIYVASSGYGPKGAEAGEPAFDLLGQARSGIMTNLGEPDAPPSIIWSAVSDQGGAIMTAYGIVVALLARERLGVGQKVDVSLLGSMMAFLGLGVGLRLYAEPFMPQPVTPAAKPSRKTTRNPLWNHYPCKDGTWLMLAMLQSDRQWPTVCKGMGIEHLAKDPRFENAQKRGENAAQLIAIMDQVFLTRTASEWVKTLKEAGEVICTPIQSIADLKNDPQVQANDYIVDVQHKVIGPVKVLGLPIQLSKTPGEIRCEAPEFGEHTEEVLIEVGGYTWEEIAQLREAEVI